MKKLAIAGLTMLLVETAAMSALAEKIPNDSPPNPSDTPGECPVVGYKVVTSSVLNLTIPDGNPAGVTTPPIQFNPDGTTIVDVVAELAIAHTWVGDLNVRLFYDHDCTPGTAPFGPVSLLCRQQLPGCPVDMCCGCSGDLSFTETYFWGTNGPNKEMAAGNQCPTAIAGGCYLVASESQFTFPLFSGLRKDGCWSLNLQDGADLDVGMLQSWKIHVANQTTTAIEPSSWGAVKAGFTQ